MNTDTDSETSMENGDDVLVTADPEVGARRLTKMPTIECNGCGEFYWDSGVDERLKQITRSNKLNDIKIVVSGSVCPECGHIQHEEKIGESL